MLLPLCGILYIYHIWRKQAELCFDENGRFVPFAEDEEAVDTLSLNEKPGIQAIKTTFENKSSTSGSDKTSIILRDYEYRR